MQKLSCTGLDTAENVTEWMGQFLTNSPSLVAGQLQEQRYHFRGHLEMQPEVGGGEEITLRQHIKSHSIDENSFSQQSFLHIPQSQKATYSCMCFFSNNHCFSV